MHLNWKEPFPPPYTHTHTHTHLGHFHRVAEIITRVLAATDDMVTETIW